MNNFIDDIFEQGEDDDVNPLTLILLEELAEKIDPDKFEENLAWRPQEGPQKEAFYSEADELFYGGAAGGGKTDLMIGLATSEASPHQKSIIFRRSYGETKDIVSRIESLYDNVKFKAGNAMRFDGLPFNKTLEVGSVPNFQEAKKYKGRPHDLKLFDEVSDIPEQVYTFLIGWTRTTEKNVPTRVVAAGNPPTTSEGRWVIRRWGAWLDSTDVNYPVPYGELRWFATLDGIDIMITPEISDEGSRGLPFTYTDKNGNKEVIFPKSRTFIPAKLEDNKYQDNQYRAVLQSMPEPYRSQLLYGDFGISMQEDPWRVVPLDWIRQSNEKWAEVEASGEIEKNIYANVIFGLDVAEGGSDYSVLVKITGNFVQYIEYYKEPDMMRLSDLVAQKMMNHKNAIIAIDATGGLGLGPAHRLQQLGFTVQPIKVSAGSKHRDRTGTFEFFNLRSELWWRVRESLNPESDNRIFIPKNRLLTVDLGSANYEIASNNKIRVDSKEKIKGRINRSPDGADALMLAIYLARRQYRRMRMI